MGVIMNLNVRARSDSIKARAKGHWKPILERLGVDQKVLSGKNQPCPVCPGGTDRFSFTDKWGNGDYYCRHCGPGDGFKLAEACLRLNFSEALDRVEEIVGAVQSLPQRHEHVPSSQFMKSLAKKIWAESKPIQAGDPVDQYLTGRGLGMDRYPAMLRCHPGLDYYEKREGDKRAKVVGSYPAMIAPMLGEDGHAVTVHRTYVSSGGKAPLPDSKKVLNTFNTGPAIRLFAATDELAITEGIETALAVRLATGKPVWAAYSASNLEKIWVPVTVKRVCIYADNDSSFTGAAAAYGLAKRLRGVKRDEGAPEVQVFIPRHVGDDWADVFCRRRLKSAS